MARKPLKKRRKRSANVLLFVLFLLLLVAAALLFFSTQPGQAPEPGPGLPSLLREAQTLVVDSLPGTTPTISEGSLQVYFAPASENDPNGMDEHFLDFLRSAQESIDAALYELDLDSVAEILITQHQRGVRVRLVSDSDYKDEHPLQRCVVAGIPLVLDNRSGFMHNKFCVVDGLALWTGSTNITHNGFFKNNNDALYFVSPELALNYSTEFMEMFEGRFFGKRGSAPTPHPMVLVGGTEVLTFFSPDDGVEEAILGEIDAARQRVDFAAFSFTSVPISEAMAARMQGGIAVRGIFEKRNAGSAYSRDEFLAERGAEVYLDGNPNNMHHKFIVVDADTVITGSYNFSKAAETKNDENCLIIRDETLAKRYLEQLEAMAAKATAVP